MSTTTVLRTAQVAQTLGIERTHLNALALRYERLLELDPGQGSGRQRGWTPRDAVGIAMILDTTDMPSWVRERLAAEIRFAENDRPVRVYAAAGNVEISYLPRWDLLDTLEVGQ